MNNHNVPCPIISLLNVLGKKRVIHILKELNEGIDTFSGIRKKIGNVNAKILTQRLEELCDYKLVSRTIVCPKPLKIRYYLTQSGKEIGIHIQQLSERASSNFSK